MSPCELHLWVATTVGARYYTVGRCARCQAERCLPLDEFVEVGAGALVALPPSRLPSIAA